MNHIDEHTLELFILHADSVETRRAEIEAHLAECRGCKDLADEIASFHAELKDELAKPRNAAASAGKALARRNEHLSPFNHLFGAPMPYIPQTRVQKFTRFVFRHPVMSGAGVLSLAAGLALLFNMATKEPAKKEITDRNPFSYHYDEAGGYLQIINKEYDKLWQIPYSHINTKLAQTEKANNVSYTKIADINGDGINEVLTILPFENDRKGEQTGKLRVFDYSKNILFEKDFDRTVKYDDGKYDQFFGAQNFVVDNFADNQADIIINANNIRSPNYIVKMNGRGDILGEYWHFGQLEGPWVIHVGPEKIKTLLLVGKNDTQDMIKQDFEAIIVLDPEKIIGVKRTTTAPLYKLTPSDAEIYYIKLPKSSIAEMLQTEFEISLESISDTLITISQTGSAKYEFPKYHYLFNNDMKIIAVKPTTLALRLSDRLVREGKLKRPLDQAYFDNLKNNVRYWDGKEWRKEATRVNHNVVADHLTRATK